MGTVIGVGGSNVRRVSEETGVDRVVVDREASVVRIVGCSAERVALARAQLEVCCVYVPVPEECIGHVVGKEGKNIAELCAKSGLDAYGDRAASMDRARGAMRLLGSRDACDKARLLIEAQLDFLEQQESEARQMEELRGQLEGMAVNWGEETFMVVRNGHGGYGHGHVPPRGGGGGRGGQEQRAQRAQPPRQPPPQPSPQAQAQAQAQAAAQQPQPFRPPPYRPPPSPPLPVEQQQPSPAASGRARTSETKVTPPRSVLPPPRAAAPVAQQATPQPRAQSGAVQPPHISRTTLPAPLSAAQPAAPEGGRPGRGRGAKASAAPVAPAAPPAAQTTTEPASGTATSDDAKPRSSNRRGRGGRGGGTGSGGAAE